MESYYFGPKFLSWFTVMGNRVTIIYEKTGEDTMLFEVLSGKEEPVSTTGKGEHEGEEIPEVQTFPFSVYQRAVLHKSK